MQKILVVEDDAAFRRSVGRLLSMHGYAVEEAGTAKAGVAKAMKSVPDLVVLDLLLPGKSGLEVCQSLKQEDRTAAVPILVLTGNDREGQEVACLDMGADDYLVKPARAERFLARCRALLRRSPGAGPEEVQDVSLGPLRLLYGRKVVAIGSKEYGHLTPKEFGLLHHLAAASPNARDRAAIYRQVWGMEPPSDMALKTVDVHIRRIRLKLGWKSDRWLVSVTGRGYCLLSPERG